MRIDRRTLHTVAVIGLAVIGGISSARAVEPGVDIASPRVAIVTADGLGLDFIPATMRVEQGDHVRWRLANGGAHTTTSGQACGFPDGHWTSNINSTTPMFTRQFQEAPGAIPYFCSPHCGLGMRGQVNVTTHIDLIVTNVVGGLTQLNWTGGGSPFRVFRSPAPQFTTGAVVLTPAAGTTQTSFLDQPDATPPADKAFFYLVMNQS